MTIKIHPIPAFSDNYLWTLHNDRHAVVVDPGDAQVVETYLSEHGLTLDAILITHHHWDHVNGLTALQDHWDCPVYAPEDDRIPGRLSVVQESDDVIIESLSLKFNVIETPGHTSSHICYHDETRLFCGDTLFSLGCGRMFEGTPEQFHQSLGKLKSLPDDLLVYCTHEYTESNWAFANHIQPNHPELMTFKESLDHQRNANLPSLPSTLAIEKALNPFLNTENTELTKALKAHGLDHSNPIEAFAILRSLKDQF